MPFDTAQVVFNKMDMDWGHLLQPTHRIMQSYIDLPQGEKILTRFKGNEKFIKPLWTRLTEHFQQQVTSHQDINRMLSNSQKVQQRMHVTIQHLLLVDITAQEGVYLAAATKNAHGQHQCSARRPRQSDTTT